MGRQTQTRDRLVRTAGELFWRHGYAQTGVSAIMKLARATSGSFYHFFPTKDDLLLAVLDAAAETIETGVLDPAERTSEDPARRVAALAGLYGDRVRPDATGFGIPVGTLVAELGADHPQALRRVERTYGALVSRVEGWFVDAGEGRRTTNDGRRLAEFIVAALEGASMMALAGRGVEAVDACAEQLTIHLDSVAEVPGSRAEEMPPPEASTAARVDWKAW